MKKPTEKQKKEFEKYFNEQMQIFRGHAERFAQRIANKYLQIIGGAEK